MVLLVLTRLMGRKQLSQITFFDYTVGITIGSIIAAVAVDRSIKIIDGMISTVIWCAMPLIVGYINIKSIRFRTLVDGKPKIVIQNGTIINKNMSTEKYNMGDLLMQLREKGIFDMTEVEYAILEPNGVLSVLKKSQYNPLTPKDMNIETPYKGLMVELIIDGRIISNHLSFINRDERWLMTRLNQENVNRLEDVVFAGLQSDGQLYVSTKNKLKGERALL